MSLWSAALDPAWRVAVVSGYLNTLRGSILGLHHCQCNFVPGLARVLDMADPATLCAPRPLLFESGMKDPIFPIASSRMALAHVRRAYSVWGMTGRITSDIFTGDHHWSGRKLQRFLNAWL